MKTSIKFFLCICSMSVMNYGANAQQVESKTSAVISPKNPEATKKPVTTTSIEVAKPVPQIVNATNLRETEATAPKIIVPGGETNTMDSKLSLPASSARSHIDQYPDRSPISPEHPVFARPAVVAVPTPAPVLVVPTKQTTPIKE